MYLNETKAVPGIIKASEAADLAKKEIKPVDPFSPPARVYESLDIIESCQNLSTDDHIELVCKYIVGTSYKQSQKTGINYLLDRIINRPFFIDFVIKKYKITRVGSPKPVYSGFGARMATAQRQRDTSEFEKIINYVNDAKLKELFNKIKGDWDYELSISEFEVDPFSGILVQVFPGGGKLITNETSYNLRINMPKFLSTILISMLTIKLLNRKEST